MTESEPTIEKTSPIFTRKELLLFLAVFIPMLLLGPNSFSTIESIPSEQKWYAGEEIYGITLVEIIDSPLSAIFSDGVDDYIVFERKWVKINGQDFKILIFEDSSPPYVWAVWKTESWINHTILSLILSGGLILILRYARLKRLGIHSIKG